MQDVMQKNETNRLTYISKEEVSNNLHRLNEVDEIKQTLMPTIEANKRLKETRAKRRKKGNRHSNAKKGKNSEGINIGKTIDLEG